MPDRILEAGQWVTTHPLKVKGRPDERSQRGVLIGPAFVPGMSRVQIGGVPQTFWNFELEPVIEAQ